jgi:hypothetical protein
MIFPRFIRGLIGGLFRLLCLAIVSACAYVALVALS